MSPFAFLLIPAVVVVVATLVVWLRGRQPTTLHSGVEGFRREMHALSPDSNAIRNPRRFESDGQLGASARRNPSPDGRPEAREPAPPGIPPPRRLDPEA